jgi:hypothetical protein
MPDTYDHRPMSADDFRERGLPAIIEERGQECTVGAVVRGSTAEEGSEAVHTTIMSRVAAGLAEKIP